jgi:hypothetical protein
MSMRPALLRTTRDCNGGECAARAHATEIRSRYGLVGSISLFAVLIPVGPDPRDLGRLQNLLGELARHEPEERARVIVVDDAPARRDLEVAWPDHRIIRTAAWSGSNPPDPLTAHVTGTLAGLEAAGDVEFVLKLDTDAAVIGPFAQQLRSAFEDPRLGVVGSYDQTSHGGVRDFSVWRGTLRRASWPVYRDPRGRPRYRPAAARRSVRRAVRLAAQKAPPGAHCLGGAYAVSRSYLERCPLDVQPWLGTRLGEDVIVGLLCLQAGLSMRSMTGREEPFALAWRGLPASPARLRAEGYSIVHSVKRATEWEEQQLRAELQR